MDKEFEGHDMSNTEPFRYQHLMTRVRVVDVHDGDTVRVVACMIPGQFVTLPVRLRDIDTAELNSPFEAGRALALRARDRLFQLVLQDSVTGPISPMLIRDELAERVCMADLRDIGIDKYGRVLADLMVGGAWSEGSSAGSILLQEGLARPYIEK
jgi:endonuclease YncB( thermonuclease family)